MKWIKDRFNVNTIKKKILTQNTIDNKGINIRIMRIKRLLTLKMKV